MRNMAKAVAFAGVWEAGAKVAPGELLDDIQVLTGKLRHEDA